ncbi:transcription elongation factor GreA, partial [Synergistaceae bacterium OttesenSCG-928-D05]|nr:transcription elongation factor GreA [Synergistaceae bacterium OttesenSCG-928-D05]
MATVRQVDDQVVMTREGYEKLKAELISLRGDGRAEIASKLEEARGFGDLSENAEYHA